MKKETPAQHPVDAYFREQESGIPVAFDPAHWDALQAMLDEANPDSASASGTRVSDLTPNAAKPSFVRFLGALLVFVFLAAVPSANPALREMKGVVVPELSGSPKIGSDDAGLVSMPVMPNTEARGDMQTLTTPGASPEQAHFDWPSLPATITSMPTDADTVNHHFYAPVVLPPDSLYRQMDSLSIRKSLKAAQDSIAEQKKKKKHLFW